MSQQGYICNIFKFENFTLYFPHHLTEIGFQLKLSLNLFQIWYESTYTYFVSKNIPFSTRTHLILLMSVETSIFENSIFTKKQ